MVSNYKRKLVSAFLTEQYCHESALKYTGKHKVLIERALYSGEDWYNMKQTLKNIAGERLKSLGQKMPFSIRKASMQLNKQF